MSITHFLGPAACLGSAALWALAANIYSRAAQKASPLAVNFMRAVLSLPIFLGVIFVHDPSGGGLRTVSAGNAGWLLVSVLGSYAAGDALFLMSTQRLGVPVALAIALAYPLWSAAAGWAFLGQTMGSAGFIGVCLVVLGVVTVVRQGKYRGSPGADVTGSDGAHSRRITGVLLAGGTSFCWALNTFAVSRGGSGLPVAAVNTVRMSMAAGLLTVIWLAAGRRLPILVPGEMMRRVWPVFILESAGGTALFVIGLTHSPLAVAAALTSLAPVISVPFAVVLGKERISPQALTGILLVTAGIVLLVGFGPP